MKMEGGGRGRKCFSYAEGGGGHNSFGIVLTRELEVLAIFKGEAQKGSTLLKGGGCTKFTLS